jgi:hypothetical protein
MKWRVGALLGAVDSKTGLTLRSCGVRVFSEYASGRILGRSWRVSRRAHPVSTLHVQRSADQAIDARGLGKRFRHPMGAARRNDSASNAESRAALLGPKRQR